MIVTLTINPAIDQNVSADRLAFEDRGYILATTESAGGRGINASRVIHSFGGKTLAIVASGGKSGSKFEKLLEGSGFPFEVVPIQQELRTNLAISDKQGLTVKLNQAGPLMTAKELGRIERAVAAILPKAKWLMICGSIPPGVSPHFYNKLIELARSSNVHTLLDTDGYPLMHGLEARPSTVTPNQQEAERLLNRALITRTHFLDAAQRIHAMGADAVLLSLGSRGAVAVNAAGSFEAIAPRVDAVCPIGAGDAMAAAYAWSMATQGDFVEAVRWGVATGTASARLPGLAFASLEQTREILKHVEIRPA
ncbi:MAG TPA: hexose kinase [Bryobacteraceae bacterium]|nr:hexose kinase [Bryobacteraceae bacterium]